MPRNATSSSPTKSVINKIQAVERETVRSPDGAKHRKKLRWSLMRKKPLSRELKIHGADWAEILIDAKFKDLLSRRNNVDLKDKWRNMIKSGKVEKLPDRPEDFRVEIGARYGGRRH